jgi:hypothetical protein
MKSHKPEPMQYFLTAQALSAQGKIKEATGAFYAATRLFPVVPEAEEDIPDRSAGTLDLRTGWPGVLRVLD